MSHRFKNVIFFILFVFQGIAWINCQAHDDVYLFGVNPYMPPARIEKAYAPVAAVFSRKTGTKVQLKTSSELPLFTPNIKKEKYDIALIPPFLVIQAIDKGNYIPLARRPSYPAAVVVLSKSNVINVDDLRQKTIGMPPTNSPVDITVQLALRDKDLLRNKNINLIHFKTPMACMHKLLLKKVDACGVGGGAALKTFEKKMNVELRSILQTPAFPHMIFVAHKRISTKHRESLKADILGWSTTESGQALLNKIGPGTGFVPYVDEDYQIVRQYLKSWQEYENTIN